MYVPADVLRVGRIRNAPVVDMKDFAELGGARLQLTPTTLDLTGVKVLQDAVRSEGGVREDRC